MSFLSLFFVLNCYTLDWHKEDHWDWSKINLDDTTFWQSLDFPKNFSWGAGISAFELEGVQNYKGTIKNNWTQDAICGPNYKKNPGTYPWHDYKKYVQDIKNAGLNSFRFSIPWEKIEPVMGLYDETAMQHYIDIVDELIKNNIEPWICLFHFTFPVWFDQLGGFEKEENLIHFIKFCNYVFDRLHKKVTFWATYNEPVAYANEAYFRGVFPPHCTWRKPFACGTVLKNMFNAHVEIYQQLKQKNKKAQIGILKMFHPLDPNYSWNILEKKAADFGNHLHHGVFMKFFKTGYFNWFYLVRDFNLEAPKSLDFIGVNYYSHEIIQLLPTFKTKKAREHEQKAIDNNCGIYAEGLYRALDLASTLNIPIYITENGIADRTATWRNEFIKRHIYVANKFRIKFDIRGYHYWTLVDTFIEGKMDTEPMFGLYAFDPKSKTTQLRKDTKLYVDFLKTQQEKWKKL